MNDMVCVYECDTERDLEVDYCMKCLDEIQYLSSRLG
jgi:hypothetical protein